MDVFGMIVELRGGLPMNCDFCGEAIPKDQLPVPEEGGAWACRACWDYWEANDGKGRPTPSSGDEKHG
jgi:hypothetical protein